MNEIYYDWNEEIGKLRAERRIQNMRDKRDWIYSEYIMYRIWCRAQEDFDKCKSELEQDKLFFKNIELFGKYCVAEELDFNSHHKQIIAERYFGFKFFYNKDLGKWEGTQTI